MTILKIMHRINIYNAIITYYNNKNIHLYVGWFENKYVKYFTKACVRKVCEVNYSQNMSIASSL